MGTCGGWCEGDPVAWRQFADLESMPSSLAAICRRCVAYETRGIRR